MTIDFQPAEFIRSLTPSTDALGHCAQLGASLAPQINRIILIGCGRQQRILLGLHYWLERYSASLALQRSTPAKLAAFPLAQLDPHTLVLLAATTDCAHELTTLIERLQHSRCHTIAVLPDIPYLTTQTQHVLSLGSGAHQEITSFLLLHALIGGLLEQKEQWPLLDDLLQALTCLPQVLAQTALDSQERATAEAYLFRHEPKLYHLASGPMFSAAEALGSCVLAQKQWMHSFQVAGAEFFHGPFEAIDRHTPLLLLLGEDPSRGQMERTVRFCQRFSPRLMVYDSQTFAMPGIRPAIRPIAAPCVVGIALERLAMHLAYWRSAPHANHLDG
jgi:fructoselysine 6-phosphate deglycase